MSRIEDKEEKERSELTLEANLKNMHIFDNNPFDKAELLQNNWGKWFSLF